MGCEKHSRGKQTVVMILCSNMTSCFELRVITFIHLFPTFSMQNIRQSSRTGSSMASSPSNRFRSGRNMPSWVVRESLPLPNHQPITIYSPSICLFPQQTESSDRVGPPPPPPPANNDPEYEVIDVANQQQYSNAPPPVPLKSPGTHSRVLRCSLLTLIQILFYLHFTHTHAPIAPFAPCIGM